MSRYKKYKMTAISSKFSEKGGYRAQFVADGYSIDARRDILPAAIKETGVQIGEGAAKLMLRNTGMTLAEIAEATGYCRHTSSTRREASRILHPQHIESTRKHESTAIGVSNAQ